MVNRFNLVAVRSAC